MHFRPIPAALAVAIALPASLLSDSVVADSKDDKVTSEQKITITGSHIRRINEEGSSPLVTIDRAEIERSGGVNLSDVLQNNIFGNGDSLNNQQTGGFTPGAASYNLRGLRADRTLILVNGERLPSYPFAGNGNVAFVDLNFIPLSEVESIVILKDGASSAYGSDAIAGVVNIITSKEFEANQLMVRASRSAGAAYANDLLTFHGGFSNENTEFLITAEYQDSDPLIGENIDASGQLNNDELTSADTFSFPGTYFTLGANSNLIATPGAGCRRSEDASVVGISATGNVCVNDWAAKRQLFPKNKRGAISTSWIQYLGDTTLNVNLAASQIETDSDVPFGLVGNDFLIDATSPFNPLGELMLLRRGFSEVGLQNINTVSKNYRGRVSVEGFIGSFDYQADVNHAVTFVDENYSDGWMSVASQDALFAEIDNGNINPFEALSAEQIETYTDSFAHVGKSYVSGASFNLSGVVSELESGDLMMAVGAEYRKEFISDNSDQAILSGDVVGLGASQAAGDRNVSAIYSEFVIPLSVALEVNAAARYDNYSDFGSTFNPKLSAKYNFTPDLLLRASWGTGFRAPNLFELNSSANGTVGSIPFVSQGNPELDAESSTSMNLGLVYAYEDSFTTSLDLWQIEVEDMISNLGVFTILTTTDDNGNLVYSQYIALNPDNSINFVVDPYVNLDSQKSKGADIAVDWTIMDGLKWHLGLSHLFSLERDNGTSNQLTELAGDYLFPKNRANMSLVYSSGQWRHELSGNYTGSHGDDFALGGYTKVDYQLHYQFSQAELVILINNMLDRQVPQLESANWPHYEQRMYSPLSRTFGLELKYQF